MILVHPLFTDPIEIQNNKINIVILEHQHLFTKFIAEIFTQVNDGTGPFLLSHDGRKLDFAKNMDIVVDVFNLTVNQKKVINNSAGIRALFDDQRAFDKYQRIFR